MVRPGSYKHGIWSGGVLQIAITRACDRSCGNCSQASNLGGKPNMMSLDNFEKACICAADYFGIIGCFGGNPAIHPKFPEICEIMKTHIPWERRGLWCNHPLGHGKIMRETFNPAVSNLNVHMDKEAASEFRRDWPECRLLGEHEDSRHSPPFVAMLDLPELDESKRWELISSCDINRRWSALLGEWRGELRFWFCEIAGSMAMIHQNDPEWPDTGLPVVPRVWDRSMQEYAEQVRFSCHRCGIPLRGYGELALDESTAGNVSKTHASIFKPKRKEQFVQLVTTLAEAKPNSLALATDYIGNSGIK